MKCRLLVLLLGGDLVSSFIPSSLVYRHNSHQIITTASHKQRYFQLNYLQEDTIVNLTDSDDDNRDDMKVSEVLQEPSIFSWNNTLATEQINDLENFIIDPSKSSLQDSTIDNTWNLPHLPDINAAVIVPGFLTGQQDFKDLATILTNMGIPSVVVPMPRWHWLPCLGGRSMTPILERIDHTVRHLSAVSGGLSDYERMTTEELDMKLSEYKNQRSQRRRRDPQDSIPNFTYSAIDCYSDFFNNPMWQVDGLEEQPVWTPKGEYPSSDEPKGRVALIGHSAGGWISRAYLSSRKYGGKMYKGHKLVHSLITLGTPHGDAPGPAFRGVKWVNSEVMDASSKVRALAVGGKGYKGESSATARASYNFCSPNGTDGSEHDGDGITPIQSALGMKEFVPHSDTLTLDDVTHFCWDEVPLGNLVAPELTNKDRQPSDNRLWYGNESVVQKWIGWL